VKRCNTRHEEIIRGLRGFRGLKHHDDEETQTIRKKITQFVTRTSGGAAQPRGYAKRTA
jgi:hypothetical protein